MMHAPPEQVTQPESVPEAGEPWAPGQTTHRQLTKRILYIAIAGSLLVHLAIAILSLAYLVLHPAAQPQRLVEIALDRPRSAVPVRPPHVRLVPPASPPPAPPPAHPVRLPAKPAPHLNAPAPIRPRPALTVARGITPGHATSVAASAASPYLAAPAPGRSRSASQAHFARADAPAAVEEFRPAHGRTMAGSGISMDLPARARAGPVGNNDTAANPNDYAGRTGGGPGARGGHYHGSRRASADMDGFETGAGTTSSGGDSDGSGGPGRHGTGVGHFGSAGDGAATGTEDGAGVSQHGGSGVRGTNFMPGETGAGSSYRRGGSEGVDGSDDSATVAAPRRAGHAPHRPHLDREEFAPPPRNLLPDDSGGPLREPKPSIPEDIRELDWSRVHKVTVRVTIEVDAQGRVTNVTLRQSSGYPSADRAVLTAWRRVPFRPKRLSGRLIDSHWPYVYYYGPDNTR